MGWIHAGTGGDGYTAAETMAGRLHNLRYGSDVSGPLLWWAELCGKMQSPDPPEIAEIRLELKKLKAEESDLDALEELKNRASAGFRAANARYLDWARALPKIGPGRHRLAVYRDSSPALSRASEHLRIAPNNKYLDVEGRDAPLELRTSEIVLPEVLEVVWEQGLKGPQANYHHALILVPQKPWNPKIGTRSRVKLLRQLTLTKRGYTLIWIVEEVR